MPRQTVKDLTALKVDKLTAPGYHRVGGVSGLCLQVKKSGARSWVLRLTFGGRRRDVGLGSYPSVTLSMARERARRVIDAAWAGNEPMTVRGQWAAEKPVAKKKTGVTFGEALVSYLGDKMSHHKNPVRARAQIESRLEAYVLPTLRDVSVSQVTVDHMLTILRPIWVEKPETAMRTRRAVEWVLDWARVAGHRAGENPARWKGNLEHVLSAMKKNNGDKHHPACPYGIAPGFLAALRSRAPSASSLALEFLILTGARSGEVREAEWSEIDFEVGIWTVPAHRMKAGKEHRVPLSSAALDVLRRSPRIAGSKLIWPGNGGKAMSDMTLAALIKKMQAGAEKAGQAGWRDRASGRMAVPHGFRSTFRDWAAEMTDYPRDMAEIALAHTVGSDVERAYRRGDMMEKRRALMEDWASYLNNAA